MKKLLMLSAVGILLVSGAGTAFAQACPSGNDGDCPGNMVCDTSVTPFTCVASDAAASGSGSVGTGGACTTDGDCSGNLACIHNVCQIDPSLEDPGTAAAGGACNPANNGSDCPGGQSCVANVTGSGGTCVGSTGNSTSVGTTNNANVSFVPLAPIPGLDSTIAPDASGIATFLNNLYKYLIGIAVVIAIIEIIWGGIEISTKDSVSRNRDGKARIYQALLGLALVLLPVLVFTIINPGILNLNINMPPINLKQYSGINTGTGSSGTGASATPNTVTPGSLPANARVINCTDATSCQNADTVCTNSGGSPETECISQDGQLHMPSLVNEVGSYIGLTQSTQCADATQSLAVVCSGATSAVPGSSGVAAGPIWVGTYMSLQSFSSSGAASSFSCQVSGASKTTFPCTSVDSTTNQCNYQYVACAVPSMSYTQIQIDPPGLLNASQNPIAADATRYNTYKGECFKMTDELANARNTQSNFSGTAQFTDSPVSEIACPPEAVPKSLAPGTTVACYSMTAGCYITQ